MAAGDLTFIDQDDQGGSYRTVFATDDFVYVANYNGNLGIMTYSVDASGGLTFRDNDDSVDQSTEGVWHDGTWAYAAYSTAGLATYTVDVTGGLTWVDTDNQIGWYFGIWGDGNYIYVGGGDQGLRSYSVTVSGILTQVDTHYNGGNYRGVWVDTVSGFIFACAMNEGLKSYSVDGLGNLSFIDEDNTIGTQYQNVWGDGTFVYAVDLSGGIATYSVDVLGNLTYIDVDDQGGRYEEVWGSGDWIFVANSIGNSDCILTYSVNPTGGLTFISSDNQVPEASGVSGNDDDLVYLAARGSGLLSYGMEPSSSSSSVSSSSSSLSSSSFSLSSSSSSLSSSSSSSSISISSSSSSVSSSSSSNSFSSSSSSESAITCDFGIHGLERVEWGESTSSSTAADTEFNKVTSNANWCEMLSYIAEAAFPRGLDTDLIFKQIRIVEDGTESEVQYEAVWVPSAGLYYADIVHYMGHQYPYGSTLWDEVTKEIIYPVEIEFISSKYLRIWVEPGSVPNDMTLVLAGQGSRWSSSSSSTAGIRITENSIIRRIEGAYGIGATKWRIIEID